MGKWLLAMGFGWGTLTIYTEIKLYWNQFYELSLFNAHTMILIFHMFMNVNKLCLTQIKTFNEWSVLPVGRCYQNQRANSHSTTASRHKKLDKTLSQRCISKAKEQEEVSWMLYTSWSGRLLACVTRFRRDGQFDTLECCWKGGLVPLVTSSGIGARCSYSPIFWHLFNSLLPPDNEERRK